MDATALPFESAPSDTPFYQSSAYFPMPVVLAVTHDESGQVNVAPYSLCFPQPDAGERMLMLIAKRDSNTWRNAVATGRVTLCFIADEPHLLEQCVELSRKLPSAEKMARSKFQLIQVGDRQVVAEAEQVFVCTLVRHQHHAEARERRMLLRVDDVLLKPRWRRALHRGWGAPRLAVEFGFRGRSATWLSRPRAVFGGPALRPTFEMRVDMSQQDAVDSLQRALDAPGVPVQGFARSGMAQINIPDGEATFFSPEMEITIEEVDGRAHLHGKIKPHPRVWTLFTAAHAAVALTAGFAGLFGLSQWMLDQPPWALWAIPAAALVHAFIAGAAFVGQGLSADHVFRLRSFVEEAVTH